MLGGVRTLTVTSSVVEEHVVPEIVQRNTLEPDDNPETADAALLAFTNVPVPETTVQSPPLAGVAAKVTEDEHTVWSFPANADGGDV